MVGVKQEVAAKQREENDPEIVAGRAVANKQLQSPASNGLVGMLFGKHGGDTTKAPFTISYYNGNQALGVSVLVYLGDGFKITSESVGPIMINSVTYNGEYQAKLARHGMRADSYGVYLDPNYRLPVKLNIGESIIIARTAIVWPNIDPDAYQKAIIFIDVETNVGTFRFDKHLSQIPNHN
jgi:hypothetical protein